MTQTKESNESAEMRNPQNATGSTWPACPICSGTSVSEFLWASDRFHGRPHRYLLLHCASCSLVWLHDAPKPEEMGEHYGIDYDRTISGAGDTSPGRWKARHDTLFQYKTAGSILDMGCSSGAFLASLPKQRWKSYGIEMSPEVAALARKISGADVFVGQILDAPFAPASFDVVTAFHVYEHVYEPAQVMRRVHDWLKPGGVFYFLVPNIHSAASRVFGERWYGLELPRHLFHYSPQSLRYIAGQSGLDVLSLTTHREPHIELSTRYIVDEILEKIGVQRPPMAKATPPNLPFKVIRKMYRLTGLRLIAGAISLAGEGESIHAVFQKPVELHAGRVR